MPHRFELSNLEDVASFLEDAEEIGTTVFITIGGRDRFAVVPADRYAAFHADALKNEQALAHADTKAQAQVRELQSRIETLKGQLATARRIASSAPPAMRPAEQRAAERRPAVAPCAVTPKSSTLSSVAKRREEAGAAAAAAPAAETLAREWQVFLAARAAATAKAEGAAEEEAAQAEEAIAEAVAEVDEAAAEVQEALAAEEDGEDAVAEDDVQEGDEEEPEEPEGLDGQEDDESAGSDEAEEREEAEDGEAEEEEADEGEVDDEAAADDDEDDEGEAADDDEEAAAAPARVLGTPTIEAYETTELPVTPLDPEDYQRSMWHDAITDRMIQVIVTEAPVEKQRLFNAVRGSFGIKRSGRDIQSHNEWLFDRTVECKQTEFNGSTFVWCLDQDPETYCTFRPYTEESGRQINEIAYEELLAAMVAVLTGSKALERDELVEATMRLLGYKRRTTRVRDVIGAAIDRAAEEGALRLFSDGTFRIPR